MEGVGGFSLARTERDHIARFSPLSAGRSKTKAYFLSVAPPTEADSEPLVLVMETLVTAPAAASVLGGLVTTVRILWKPIAGTTTEMKTDSRGLSGRGRSVVANLALPHRQDDSVRCGDRGDGSDGGTAGEDRQGSPRRQ